MKKKLISFSHFQSIKQLILWMTLGGVLRKIASSQLR